MGCRALCSPPPHQHNTGRSFWVAPTQPSVHAPLPPPFVIATPKYGMNTVPTPTVAITRAWLAHDTYNYRHTREGMHGMSELVQERGR